MPGARKVAFLFGHDAKLFASAPQGHGPNSCGLGLCLNLGNGLEEFILSLNGVESVDRLMAQCDLPGRKSADFLALNRRVIIEQKSLDIDPHHKVPEFFEKHTNLENFVDGDLTALSHLLRRLPEGTKLGIDLYRSLTKGLDDILSYADKQTRDTRKTFFIPDAIGVVVILNDSAPTLEPDIVTIKAAEMLRKDFRTSKSPLIKNSNTFDGRFSSSACGIWPAPAGQRVR